MEITTEGGIGKRIDVFLAETTGYSRSAVQRLIKAGLVYVNREKVKANYKIRKDDLIDLTLDEKREEEIEPEDLPIDVLYEDQWIIVVNKPPNLIVHPTPTKRSGTLINRLLHHTRLSKLGSPYRPGVVHRLDKDTSGLLVFAKRDSSYINLVRQFMAREVGRTYVALVAGIISEKRGLVDAPIGRRKHDRTKMGIEGFFGKRAITTFETLERFYTGEGYTLLSIRLGTGRTHQIRVHMSYIGHPVVGDKQYGRRRGGDLDMRINRQALHAKTLEFKHPEGNKLMRFSCNLPNDLQDTITHLREISKKHRLHHLDFKKT